MPPQDTSSAENLLALHALARKYTLVDGVAFAFIENSKGEVIVHTLGTFPPELQQGLPITGATAEPTAENYHCQEEPCTQPASPFLRDS